MRCAEVQQIARRCPQFGMCKIDFLGTGVCPAGSKHGYAAYYPQGRMLIVAALAQRTIPLTNRLVHIAESCTLCGICDKQCYFLAELRSLEVMRALKEHVESHVRDGTPVETLPDDEILEELWAVVGETWVSHDPAILAAYAKARSPSMPLSPPRYVVLPSSTEEVSRIVTIAERHALDYVVRGAGTSFAGALCRGIVLDVIRLKNLQLDPQSWTATIGAGVTAFELQTEAARHGLRANVAEPAACVCANLISTNMHSLYSHAYGVGADNYVDGEIVGKGGTVFRLNNPASPNLFGFDPPTPNQTAVSPGICTQITVKLFPMGQDEKAIMVPFAEFLPCLELARDVGHQRIGVAAGVIGTKYLSTFSAPTYAAARHFEDLLAGKLGMRYALLVLGDQYEIDALKDRCEVFVDQDLLRTLLLSPSDGADTEGIDVLADLGDSENLYESIFKPDMRPVVEMSFTPSPENLVELVDEDMKDFYRDVYRRKEMTDIVWLNMFRILSGRMGRRKTFSARILWCPLDEPSLLVSICQDLKEIADRHDVENAFGYLVPIDHGKRAIMEYDYYFDQGNDCELENVCLAIAESRVLMQSLASTEHGIRPGEMLASQGLCRKEAYLYA